MKVNIWYSIRPIQIITLTQAGDLTKIHHKAWPPHEVCTALTRRIYLSSLFHSDQNYHPKLSKDPTPCTFGDLWKHPSFMVSLCRSWWVFSQAPPGFVGFDWGRWILSAWIHYYYHTHVVLEKDSRILNFFTAHTIVWYDFLFNMYLHFVYFMM